MTYFLPLLSRRAIGHASKCSTSVVAQAHHPEIPADGMEAVQRRQVCAGSSEIQMVGSKDHGTMDPGARTVLSTDHPKSNIKN
jgi:hypothetical protein